jgi:hypothetical protein
MFSKKGPFKPLLNHLFMIQKSAAIQKYSTNAVQGTVSKRTPITQSNSIILFQGEYVK